MKTVPSLALVWLATTLLVPPLGAVQQLLIIGDSLSKEYEYEGPGIGATQAPAGLHSWTEILDDKRHAYFDFGTSATRTDLRTLGHTYNWSVPGSMASEWADTYLTASFPQNYAYGIPELTSQLGSDAERIVVLLGGNEIRASYGGLYDGTTSATNFADDLYGNIASVVNWVLDRKRSSAEMVIVNLPHLGATPSKNDAHPYDVTKTGRVTTAITRVNAQLATLAQTKGLGYADIYSTFSGLLNSDHLCIGGVPIWLYPPHEDADPHYCFLGDGLHPNMPVQAVIAQIILDTFNSKFHHSYPRLTNSEILTDVLGLRTDLVFDDWLRGFGLGASQRGATQDPDHDGVPNLMEYALDQDPTRSDRPLLPQPERVLIGGVTYVGLSWKPIFQNCAWGDLWAEQSADLRTWTRVPPAYVTLNSVTRTFTVRIPRPAQSPPLFLRLKAEVLP